MIKGTPIIKTNQEVEIMREGALIWQQIRKKITPFVQIGKTGIEIEKKVEELFKEHGVTPCFNGYKNFPGIICVSVNDCIVHGLANDKPLKSGDKITLDIGFLYKNLHIDSAFTLLMDAEKYPEYQSLIDHTHKALWAGINAIKKETFTGDITEAIETYVEKNVSKKYSIIDSFTGHGVGKDLHEQPYIYNKGFKKGEGVLLSKNSIICIEPMLLEQTNGKFSFGENGFDILADKPNAMTVHWEHMVLIGKNGPEILTADDDEIAKYRVN